MFRQFCCQPSCRMLLILLFLVVSTFLEASSSSLRCHEGTCKDFRKHVNYYESKYSSVIRAGTSRRNVGFDTRYSYGMKEYARSVKKRPGVHPDVELVDMSSIPGHRPPMPAYKKEHQFCGTNHEEIGWHPLHG